MSFRLPHLGVYDDVALQPPVQGVDAGRRCDCGWPKAILVECVRGFVRDLVAQLCVVISWGCQALGDEQYRET